MLIKPPSPEISFDFLKRFHPNGGWVITAIKPDKKDSSGIITRTFNADKKGAFFAFIKEYNGKRNLYFNVNPVIKKLKKNARLEDIKKVTWLHVDIDPRAGEELETEQERCLNLLTKKLPKGVPAPTVIIFSGGGYQPMWRLEKAIPIDGNLTLAEDAKRYNQQLEVLFGGDNCHNINRIMRLPGTINIPDKKKRAKGRIEAVAELVEFHEDRVYPIDCFKQAPLQPKTEMAGFGGGSLPEELPVLESVEDLPESVMRRTKTMIVQGNDPDNPDKYKSKSEALFAVICDLFRAKVSNEMILSIILDPKYKISVSVLDKPKPRKYAKRQVRRGREFTIDPLLMELNDRHAVISNIGGKCRVMEEITDPILNRNYITFQSFFDFQNRYKNLKVSWNDSEGNVKYKPAAKWWLEHNLRRQYDTIVYAPGQNVEGYLNLWKGFATKPKQGKWQKLKNHIEKVLADGDEEAAEYILNWAAWAIQNPGSPAEAALVLIGGRGTGKGTFARALCQIFGPHSLHISSAMHLSGRFNAHFRDISLLFADEAYWPGERAAEGTLKRLITEPTLTIEAKGVDLVEIQNCLHVIMASNEEWVVPAGIDERRFAVFQVSDLKKQDEGWFKPIQEEMDDQGGLEAMHYDLLNLDLHGWHPRKIPANAALSTQKERSLSPLEDWFIQLLEEGLLPYAKGDGENRAFSKDLYEHLIGTTPLARNISTKKMGDFLRNQGCIPWSNGFKRGWEFLPLQTLRDEWSEKIQKKEWQNPNMDWGQDKVPF